VAAKVLYITSDGVVHSVFDEKGNPRFSVHVPEDKVIHRIQKWRLTWGE